MKSMAGKECIGVLVTYLDAQSGNVAVTYGRFSYQYHRLRLKLYKTFKKQCNTK